MKLFRKSAIGIAVAAAISAGMVFVQVANATTPITHEQGGNGSFKGVMISGVLNTSKFILPGGQFCDCSGESMREVIFNDWVFDINDSPESYAEQAIYALSTLSDAFKLRFFLRSASNNNAEKEEASVGDSDATETIVASRKWYQRIVGFRESRSSNNSHAVKI